MQDTDRSTSSTLVRSPLCSDSLQVLLIQARSASRMARQEQACFVERSRVPQECFDIVNVATGDSMPDHLNRVDAVLIGGAGKYSATKDYPWMEALLQFVRRTVHHEVPLFGSCWGHQIIVRALGGTVVYDPEYSELGCRWVELTDAGQRDPLFRRFPRRFRANMGHHDRVVELPTGAIELARNDQPYQAFRLRDLPVYGTQFHSELDARRERERILTYKKQYQDALPEDRSVQEVLDSLADTTAVDDLLYDFLMTFVARRPSLPLNTVEALPDKTDVTLVPKQPPSDLPFSRQTKSQGL